MKILLFLEVAVGELHKEGVVALIEGAAVNLGEVMESASCNDDEAVVDFSSSLTFSISLS